jgi:hypothetical protein
MQIGVVHRAAIAFTGLIIAFAVVLCLTPIGSTSANDRPSAFTGVPRAGVPKVADRDDQPAKPRADKPRADKAKAEQPDPEPKPQADLGEVTNSAGEPLDVSDGACRENRELAAKRGLTLPANYAIHCVGPGLDWNGNSHWGVTCPYDSCPEGAGPYVSISNPTYYVVAHELCHANNGTDELAADACAADHGASLAESPYQ